MTRDERGAVAFAAICKDPWPSIPEEHRESYRKIADAVVATVKPSKRVMAVVAMDDGNGGKIRLFSDEKIGWKCFLEDPKSLKIWTAVADDISWSPEDKAADGNLS